MTAFSYMPQTLGAPGAFAFSARRRKSCTLEAVLPSFGMTRLHTSMIRGSRRLRRSQSWTFPLCRDGVDNRLAEHRDSYYYRAI
jgi:hypothetical protein